IRKAASGAAALAGARMLQAALRATKATPNATPMIAVTRMSRVRHRPSAATRDPVSGGEGAIEVMAADPPRQKRRPPEEDGIELERACFLRRYEPDQVRRVCGWATLSAPWRSPEAIFSCGGILHPFVRWSLRGAGRLLELRVDPGDDVGDDLRPLRFVVGLVADARVRAPPHP